MQKNLIIAILVVIVLVMLFSSGKDRHPSTDTPQSDEKKPPAAYSNPNTPSPWTQPPQPPTEFQHSPIPGEYYPYSNTPQQLYGMPQTQSYGVNQPFTGTMGQPQFYQQQPYGTDNWQYPQYSAPRYRFRDPSRVEPENPYPTDHYENNSAQSDHRPQSNSLPFSSQGSYTPYQQQHAPVFNIEPGSHEYIPSQPQGRYRGEY